MTPCPPLPSRTCRTRVRALVETRLGHTARVSVWAGEPAGAAWFTREPDAQHYAASTMKLPLLVAAYRRAERGELDLDRAVPVHNAHRSAYDGSLFSLEQDDDQDDETWDRLGSCVDLRTLARHAVVRSGNLATDLLLEHVGTAEVAAVLRDAGCSPRPCCRAGSATPRPASTGWTTW